MKTKMFTFWLALFSFATCFMFVAPMVTGAAEARGFDNAYVRAEMACDAAMLTGTYTASVALDPAASAGAIVTVTPTYAGMYGFDSARLSAVIGSGGSVLTATLSGFTGNELPEGEVLGYITVRETGNDRVFVVMVDGGAIGIDEMDF